MLPSDGTFGASGLVCPMAQTLMPLGPEFALLAPRNVHWIPAPSLYSWMWERFFGPVSSWKFCVPEGTLASPLVLDKFHWATSLARPSHCLVLQHQPPPLLSLRSALAGHPRGWVRKGSQPSYSLLCLASPTQPARGLLFLSASLWEALGANPVGGVG